MCQPDSAQSYRRYTRSLLARQSSFIQARDQSVDPKYVDMTLADVRDVIYFLVKYNEQFGPDCQAPSFFYTIGINVLR